MDLTHNHLDFGVVEGCPGCEQHILDFARARYTSLLGPGLEDGSARLQLWYSVRHFTRDELLSRTPRVTSLVP